MASHDKNLRILQFRSQNKPWEAAKSICKQSWDTLKLCYVFQVYYDKTSWVDKHDKTRPEVDVDPDNQIMIAGATENDKKQDPSIDDAGFENYSLLDRLMEIVRSAL